MPIYSVKVCVKEVRGFCAIGYKPGDYFYIDSFYIRAGQKCKICLHAFNAMLTLLTPFLKGVSAKKLGIGRDDDVGYVQCPDIGKPYTPGGNVIFELQRKKID